MPCASVLKCRLVRLGAAAQPNSTFETEVCTGTAQWHLKHPGREHIRHVRVQGTSGGLRGGTLVLRWQGCYAARSWHRHPATNPVSLSGQKGYIYIYIYIHVLAASVDLGLLAPVACHRRCHAAGGPEAAGFKSSSSITRRCCTEEVSIYMYVTCMAWLVLGLLHI